MPFRFHDDGFAFYGNPPSVHDFDDAPTTEFTRDEQTTPFWREARDEWAQRDNDETAAATLRAKERR